MPELVVGVIMVLSGIAMFVFRRRLANFFQWWHREGPIGSGEPAAQASTLGYVAVFAFGWALFGVCLIF
jgi:hypothetical protein